MEKWESSGNNSKGSNNFRSPMDRFSDGKVGVVVSKKQHVQKRENSSVKVYVGTVNRPSKVTVVDTRVEDMIKEEDIDFPTVAINMQNKDINSTSGVYVIADNGVAGAATAEKQVAVKSKVILLFSSHDNVNHVVVRVMDKTKANEGI
ncbi:hypothetical protein V6N13_007689 [Hibiscus sabdariffa]|uniref:Uncharacterized protein n=1 Tax=Hibiscus sabdariffa TaxID=183260 RepID=A0ABR2EPM1_9ROSI